MMTTAPRFTGSPLRCSGQTALAAALMVVLAGCSLTPKYERPAAPVASQWPSQDGMAAAPGESAAELPWQDFVQDAGLRELITLALANNRDLRVAIANIVRPALNTRSAAPTRCPRSTAR